MTPETFREITGLADVPQVAPAEAISWFRSRVPLPMKTASRIVDASLVRGKLAREQLTEFVQEAIQGEISAALQDGKSLRWFTDHVQQILERSGFAPANPHHLETVFQTNLTSAYNAGRIAELQHPDVAAVFPWWQYTNSDPVTEICQAMEGRVYRADDLIWKVYTPPNHYRCKSILTPVSRDDLDAEDLVVHRAPPRAGGVVLRPDVGFRRNVAAAMVRNPAAAIG